MSGRKCPCNSDTALLDPLDTLRLVDLSQMVILGWHLESLAS